MEKYKCPPADEYYISIQQSIIHSYKEIKFWYFYNMNLKKKHVKWENPVTKYYILYNSMYITCPEETEL